MPLGELLQGLVLTMNQEHPDIIFQYTTQDAIDDGVIIHPYPDVMPSLYITPTIKVMVEEVCKSDNREFDHVLIPLLMDVTMQFAAKPDSLVILEHTAVGTVWIQPNDLSGLTVMKPEDY